jgi:5'-nucleotidase
MHILVTNDDGVWAPGLLALAKEMRKVGEVTVLAPDRNWSISGHVKTLDRPLRVRETTLADGTAAYTSDGAPSDCVALALLGLVAQTDLVIAGINPTPNLSHDVTYSGTVTAAMEAAIANVTGIAVSLNGPESSMDALDYGPAAAVARRIVEKVAQDELPEGVILNVNVPYLAADDMKGYMITRQGLRVYRDTLDRRTDPRGKPYYWIGGVGHTDVNEAGTDVGALADGYVSITPLQLDLTNYKAVASLRQWKWG